MIGSNITHYAILEKLGEGGMGVVYKAHDTKLDRFVALKFLPSHLAASEQDKTRFIQEAKSASALNHPNVCTIHDIQNYSGEDGKHQLFIVMEFLEGQTLRERKGTVSFKQAIEIGIQIAEGLSAAHEKGIVHRDIKPDNIMIRKDGIAQIMDFGLAKLQGASQLTKVGSTVGTAGYMSPEQVQGLEADHRSDIFSFGVLLYELLTSELPFKGIHETAIAYEIVNVDSAPMSSIKPEIDPALDTIVLECLEKDPNERAQSIKQIALDLKRYKRESSRTQMSRITSARPAVAASQQKNVLQEQSSKISTSIFKSWYFLLLAVVIFFSIGYFTAVTIKKEKQLPAVRASINIPHGIRYYDDIGGHSSISPDGSMIIFVGIDSLNRQTLYIHSLKNNETKILAGAERATYPSWSNDSKSVAFFADGKLKTIDAKGGPAIELANAPFGRGLAWNENGEILYSPSVADPNLYVVSSMGGSPSIVTNFDSASGKAPRFPSFLPDGKHYIFSLLEIKGIGTNSDVYLGSIENNETKKIISESAYGRYEDGFLFYIKQGILVAQPFDISSFSLKGKPISIQGNINAWPPRAKADFSLSDNGVLLFATGGSSRSNELLLFGEDGKEEELAELQYFTTVVLSPDETMVAYDQVEVKNKRTSVWIYDLQKKINTQLIFKDYAASAPCWSHDGKKIFYNSEVDGRKANIFVKNTDGSDEEELIAEDTVNVAIGFYPEDISPDGRYLLISIRNELKSEIGFIDLKEQKKIRTIVRLGLAGRNVRFSPDGRWISYQSNASVSSKIFVSSFSTNPITWQLPVESGNRLSWGQGKIFYYATSKDRYEYCTVSLKNGVPSFGTPLPVFNSKTNTGAVIFSSSKKGNKYYGMRPANAGFSSSLSVIVNWRGLNEQSNVE